MAHPPLTLHQFARSDFTIDSQVFHRWELQFTTLAGVIHNLDPLDSQLDSHLLAGKMAQIAISVQRSPFSWGEEGAIPPLDHCHHHFCSKDNIAQTQQLLLIPLRLLLSPCYPIVLSCLFITTAPLSNPLITSSLTSHHELVFTSSLYVALPIEIEHG